MDTFRQTTSCGLWNNCNKSSVFEKTAILFLFNILALCFLLSFGGENYSVDSYGVLLSNYQVHIEAFAGAYRFFGAALFRVLRFFHYDPIKNATPTLFVYMGTVATCTTYLAFLLEKELNYKKRLVMIDIALLIASCNCWYCDILSFPESIVIAMAGVVLTFVAIGLTVRSDKQKVRHYIVAAVCLIMATASYQQFFALFAVLAIAICCTKVWENNGSFGDNLRIFMRPAILWISSGVVYYLVAKAIVSILGISSNARATNGIQEMISNTIHIIRNFHSYAKGRGYFKTEILTICFLTAVLIFCSAILAETKKRPQKALLVLAFLGIAYLCSISAAILSATRGARAMFPFFAIYSLMYFAIPNTSKKSFDSILTCVLILVLVLNIGKTLEREAELKKNNAIEEAWCRQVLSEIDAYEMASGNIVHKVYVGSDDKCAFPGSSLEVNYARNAMIKLFAGNRDDFLVSTISNEQFSEFFGGKNWDHYIAAEQVVFYDDAAFVCVY